MVETVLRVGLRAAVAVTVLGTAAISAHQSPAADALRATLLERAADGDCVPIIPDLEAMHNAQPGDAAVTAGLSQCLRSL